MPRRRAGVGVVRRSSRHPGSPQDAPRCDFFKTKIDPKMHQKMIDVEIDFWTSLAPFGAPSWGHVGAMLGSCWPRFRKKWRLDAVLARSWAALVPTADGVHQYWCHGPMGYPILGVPSRWGTPFWADFEPHVGAKLSLCCGIWHADFWIWPGGMRDAIE